MKNLFKVSSILWIIWGIVHILAGVFTISKAVNDDITGAIAGIADALNPEVLKADYHEAVGAVIANHGFNLFWIGIVTLICAFYIWKGKKNAIFLAAICGGLADLAYFLFMDLGGYVKFMPGTVMTIFSSVAIITSFYAHYKLKDKK